MNKTAPIDKQPSTIEGEIYNIIDTAIIEGVDPDNHGYAAKQAHSAITKLIESAVIEFADKCIKELELFTAGHDRAMRDEAIDIIKAELQAQAKEK